jgi:hypothetical protein
MKAGDVDTTPDEEDSESDDSTDGEDDDPMPPSAEEDEVIARWAWIGGAMREAQNADENVSMVKAWVETDKRPQAFQLDTEGQEVQALVCRWHELFVRDGILMRRAPRGYQVVLPRSTRADIYRHIHAGPWTGGHMGRDRTYFHVRRKGWWPGYRADITEWVRNCHHCQLVKPGPGKGKQRLKQERVGVPRERVAINLIGPLPPSRRGKKYLVVMQDCFSKWVEVDAIATKKTTVVAQSFVNTWVTTFGCP